jgi:SET domain
MTASAIPISDPPYRVVSGRPFGKALVTTRPIARGEAVASWAGARRLRRPTWQSVQISERRHAEDPRSLNLLNHACEPNVFIDIPRRRVVALRRIRPGELLAFFYPSTEWSMARRFPCRCGSKRCLLEVRGARDLPLRMLRRAPVSAHILRLKRAQVRRLKAARARGKASRTTQTSNLTALSRLSLRPAAGTTVTSHRRATGGTR